MTPLSLSLVAEGDAERALDTLVLAFAADPVERWLYPEGHEYLRWFPAFLAAFGGRYERQGFEVTGRAQAGACPPVTFMLRAAR
jgi:hypothetical protein